MSEDAIHAKRVDQFVAIYKHFAEQYSDVEADALAKLGLISKENLAYFTQKTIDTAILNANYEDLRERIKKLTEVEITGYQEFAVELPNRSQLIDILREAFEE